ncbi:MULTISPECIES: hypothetical protein [Gammaproteobacteria]|uniref:hypothetical protein n=1 Tax=Gammaproteobacteria TaxID=1236 RepID=UPI000DD09721|nr:MULTISPECIES: hypothetical protein [Gammaproteobacteria]RTE86358.1 hypothetical protein DQX04_07280 [Aliidiomarina sp. B3213]TCZ91708.1 hypothetical protein EYQ95_07290 [Lysobacter sp. N42]
MRLVLVLFLVFASTSLMASELATREQISNRVNALFHSGEYEQLSNLGNEFIDTEARTSSGLWKLRLFYVSLYGISNRNIPDLDYWNNLKSEMKEWTEMEPDSSVAHLAYVETLIAQAWMYRRHTVRDEDRVLFDQNIEEARLYLLEHESMKSRDPHWFHRMIDVARAQSWEESRFNALIDEAFTQHPAYYPIYFSALRYLLPNWHGSAEKIENFANYAVEKSEESEGYGLYARIYWVAYSDHYSFNLFSHSDISWEKMKSGIDDVLQDYPDQWNINYFALFSCLAGDREETLRLMNMIEGRPIIDAWRTGFNYSRCAEWSAVEDPAI